MLNQARGTHAPMWMSSIDGVIVVWNRYTYNMPKLFWYAEDIHENTLHTHVTVGRLHTWIHLITLIRGNEVMHNLVAYVCVCVCQCDSGIFGFFE